jgi:hypothetical protein
MEKQFSGEGADKDCIHDFVGVTSHEKFTGKIKENVE